ncbi:hypothetical protein [Streptomyces sp. KS_5]|uniref:hypothetical protein n=1 Tax=Streptomyces sp. KS_5 TaxID=1881018 RepID=UPI0035252D30
MGSIELRHEALNIRSSPGQQLIILQAEPDSPSADALALLGSMTAPTLPHQQESASDN